MMNECYHCSCPIGDDPSVNDGGMAYHLGCYVSVVLGDSCSECGGVRPDAYIVSRTGLLVAIHAACIADRARRIA